jgi:hypothetical protein
VPTPTPPLPPAQSRPLPPPTHPLLPTLLPTPTLNLLPLPTPRPNQLVISHVRHRRRPRATNPCRPVTPPNLRPTTPRLCRQLRLHHQHRPTTRQPRLRPTTPRLCRQLRPRYPHRPVISPTSMPTLTQTSTPAALLPPALSPPLPPTPHLLLPTLLPILTLDLRPLPTPMPIPLPLPLPTLRLRRPTAPHPRSLPRQHIPVASPLHHPATSRPYQLVTSRIHHRRRPRTVDPCRQAAPPKLRPATPLLYRPPRPRHPHRPVISLPLQHPLPQPPVYIKSHISAAHVSMRTHRLGSRLLAIRSMQHTLLTPTRVVPTPPTPPEPQRPQSLPSKVE